MGIPNDTKVGDINRFEVVNVGNEAATLKKINKKVYHLLKMQNHWLKTQSKIKRVEKNNGKYLKVLI
jgi:hypothetical protein